MRHIIINIMKIVMLAFLCPLLMGAHVGKPLQGSSSSTTIQTNPDFPSDYYITAGTNYPKGYADLTYKMIDVVGQKGLFTSYEQSIIYITVMPGVQGLPPGLSTDQTLNKTQPTDNTFFIFGTVPADFPEGIYPVTITGQDGALTSNTAIQVINLHISSSTPQPLQKNLQIIGNVGETPNPSNMLPYFDPTKIMDQFQVGAGSTLPPGITLAPNGVFIGNYTQAGVYNVLVEAENNATQIWSVPLTVTFIVSEHDSPPVPKPAITVSRNVGDAVVQNPPDFNSDMKSSFTLNAGASNITACQLASDPTVLASIGLSFSNCTLTGNTYTKAGYYTVQVQAQNNMHIWSAPFTINFAISLPDSTPTPKPAITVARNVGDPVVQTPPDFNPDMKSDFILNPGASEITSCQLASDPTVLASIGLSFSNCTLTGSAYTKAGTYAVQVQAKNGTNVWSDPFTINFAISVPDSPPQPNQPNSLDIYDKVGNPVTVDNMQTHFTTNPGSSPIIAYQLVSPIPSATGITFNTSDGSFAGTYAQVGTFPIQVEAENALHVWSAPFTMNFIISPKSSTIPPATLTCPAVSQVIDCATSAVVTDSDGVTHQFVRKDCQGFVTDFYAAYLRTANPAYPNGLSCVYLDMTEMPTVIYVLNSVPANTYYGNDTNQTAATCTISPAGCSFNIPH